jgi:hypothetical protein
MKPSPSENIDAQFIACTPELRRAIEDHNHFWSALSDGERAALQELHKLLVKNLKGRTHSMTESQADFYIEKTVEEAGVDKQLFQRWWKVLVPYVNCGVRFNQARSLLWAKIAPSEIRDDSLAAAKLAARNLKNSADRVRMEAERENRRFFIDLGKCLSGEIKPEPFSDMDSEIVRILSINPSITAKDAVCELAKKNWHISEDHFRVIKQRLKRAIIANRAEYDQSGKP